MGASGRRRKKKKKTTIGRPRKVGRGQSYGTKRDANHLAVMMGVSGGSSNGERRGGLVAAGAAVAGIGPKQIHSAPPPTAMPRRPTANGWPPGVNLGHAWRRRRLVWARGRHGADQQDARPVGIVNTLPCESYRTFSPNHIGVFAILSDLVEVKSRVQSWLTASQPSMQPHETDRPIGICPDPVLTLITGQNWEDYNTTPHHRAAMETGTAWRRQRSINYSAHQSVAYPRARFPSSWEANHPCSQQR